MEENRALERGETAASKESEEVFDGGARSGLRQLYDALPMAGKDWAMVALCLMCAGFLCLPASLPFRFRAGAAQLFMLIAGLFAAGKRRVPGSAWFLISCDCALILVSMAFYDSFLFGVNLAAIPLLTALALFGAAGISDPMRFGAAAEAMGRSARGAFAYLPLPILRAFQKREGRANGLAVTLISLAICIPVVLGVLLLLSSADAVFSDRIDQICAALIPAPEDHLILRIVGAILLGLMMFSWMFALAQPGKSARERKQLRVPTLFPILLTAMLNAVYALFVYIQFSYLFGGGETAAMTGGYAQYARSGFFQLVAVAAINLGALILAQLSGRAPALRILSGLLIAQTGVILVSAVWRMRLYIQVYGLTVLRVMTLWGALSIGVLLAIVAIRLIWPRFRAYSAGFVCLILLWIGLNGANIDRIIAEYNVRGYQSGALEQIDEAYIGSLAPSAQDALSRLERSEGSGSEKGAKWEK